MSPVNLSSSLDYSPPLNSTRPRSHTASTLDDFEGQLQHQEDHALASSSNGKPRASSSSFHGSSFQYSSFKPLFDDDSDDDEDQEDNTTQFILQPAPPPPSTKKSFLLGSSAQPPTSSLSSPSVSSLLPIQIDQRPTLFHNASFNYQSFKPLFDDSDDEKQETGRVEAANNRGRKASVEEGFEAVTPDLLPQRAAKEVEDGLRLDTAGAGKEAIGAWEKGRTDGQEVAGGGGAVVI